MYKGEIKLPGQPAMKVAIKTLKVPCLFVHTQENVFYSEKRSYTSELIGANRLLGGSIAQKSNRLSH